MVGKPLVTGGVLTAPVGTALPTDPQAALNAAFKAVGYITDSGVVKSEKRNTGTINAWGGDTIAATSKGYDVTIKLDLAEFLNSVTQSLIYGTANVVATAAVAAIGTPVLTLGTTSTTGGTLAAGTYYWKLTAINASGETVGSNEVTATTTGSTSSQPFTWVAITGATGYKLYRGTVAGAENILVTTLGTVTSYTDTGSAGTAGTVPSVGSTGSKGNQLKVTATSAPTPHNSWIFEIINDAKKVRLVVPDGKVMDTGDTTFKDDAIAAAALTLQAFPDASGAYYYVYTDDGVRL
ncbi:MAG: hypothetical protein M3O29_03990 [Actinomycetota bacterium]|nr:hypothetical protein [Actinomycetota bacterium]